jgi:microcompartment protein CcmK/EutM
MRVLISSDGKGARELVGAKNSPVRWLTIGVLDE